MAASHPVAAPASSFRLARLSWPLLVLVAGAAALVIPTLLTLARESWSSEQGQHSPIVLAIGVWLVWRSWPQMRAQAVPGSPWVTAAALLVIGAVYVLTRIADQFLIEAFALYGLALTVIYAFVGARAMLRSWFPLVYLIFALPMPFMLTWPVSHHLRFWISDMTVQILQTFGFSVARNGLSILIDQYEIVIAQACSGMNSLISLSAIGLFYIYIRRSPRPIFYAFYIPLIIAFAIIGNLGRVLILVLLTHYFGDAVAQGYLHETAGMVTFTISLVGVILVDAAFAAFMQSRGRSLA